MNQGFIFSTLKMYEFSLCGGLYKALETSKEISSILLVPCRGLPSIQLWFNVNITSYTLYQRWINVKLTPFVC